MQATKRHKTLKKEFLLRFLCLFAARKILSALEEPAGEEYRVQSVLGRSGRTPLNGSVSA